MKKHNSDKLFNIKMFSNWKQKPFSSMLLLLLYSILFSSWSVESLRINPDGGYEDLVISVSNEVPPIICQQLLQNIQSVFTSASDYLRSTTGNSVYFHQIVVVLPAKWESTKACGLQPKEFVSASSIHKAPFVITDEHPIFGHVPFTQQSQGCKLPGDYISMGYEFLLPNNDTSDNFNFLNQDRTLVHEWTKYRYGVFEEIGFENDPIYPVSYTVTTRNNKSQIENELKPNYCTNEDLHGDWSSSCMNSPTKENCVFTLNNTNNNAHAHEQITSSIMSVPYLPNVENYCDSENHNTLAPSKQNFLCHGKSIQEIMIAHPDFSNTIDNREPHRVKKRISPSIIVKQLVRPRFVLMVEESPSMNLRDVWKFLRLSIRKFIKYDLENGTQIGLITVNSDITVLANMTTLTESVRGNLAEKLPNYPSKVENKGSLSLMKGISQAINMLKMNGAKASGSVIILISQGSISKLDIDPSLRLLQQEDVSLTTIDYPSTFLDGRVSILSQKTNSPYYSVRETPVGTTYSHMSTYVQLVNAMADIQRFFTQGIGNKYPHLIHQEEFRGDSLSFVESSFHFFNPSTSSSSPAEFHIYIPNPIDPKVNKVELTSPTGKKYTDQLSFLHDINVIKIDARIDQQGLWTYRIERLGDSYQSHFVQVVSMTTNGGSDGDVGKFSSSSSSSSGIGSSSGYSETSKFMTRSNSNQPLTVRIYSNRDETRIVDMGHEELILYADVKRGNSPVLGAHVEAFIVPADGRMAGWSTILLDSGNGDPDITKGDGVYSRYIVPPASIRDGPLDFTVKVKTMPKNSKFIDYSNPQLTLITDDDAAANNNNNGNSNNLIIQNPLPCCGSDLSSASFSLNKRRESNSLKIMPYTESVSSSYSVKVSNIKSSHIYPPNRVGDLKVIDFSDKNITFSFTAPGDDFDHGMVQGYEFYISDSRISQNIIKGPYISTTTPTTPSNIDVQYYKSNVSAGSIVNLTIPFPTYNIYYVWLEAIDPYKVKSLRSNIIEVNVLNPSILYGNSDLLADGNGTVGSRKEGRKLSSAQIVYTVVGVVGFCILVIGIVIICICCRRKASKKEMDAANEQKVYTIPHVKGPIHWSASELLQEHEKRQSIYAQSQRSDNQSQVNNSQQQEHHQQQGQIHGIYGHSQNRQSNFHNISPGSSTRSFRSFNEGQYRTSFDSTGRRITDYESCSSDPILKGGPTDYDTAVDSDQDQDFHYRTIDSYVGAAYRANQNLRIQHQQQHQVIHTVGGGQRTSMDAQHSSIMNTSVVTPVQYNSNYQGSLTSVNSGKRRNITMV